MQLSILLLNADPQSADAVTTVLTRVGHTVVPVTTAEDFVALARQHTLLIVDGLPPGTTPAALLEEVRAAPEAGAQPVLCIAQSDNIEERIAYLEAGADDVLRKPYDPRELEALVEALGLRAERSHGAPDGFSAIGAGQRRHVVVVYSPKGGVGTTTVATNLALLAAERHPGNAALVDLDLQFGQVSTHLNLDARQTLLDLIRDGVALSDTDLFRTYATSHRSGVQVFAAPTNPGFASMFTAQHVDAILDRAGQGFETVIVDAGNALDDLTLTAISRAETLVVPVIPEIPSLKAVHALLDQLAETGSMGARTMFVLNNIFSRDLLRIHDVEQALGGRIAAQIPYDPFVYLKAVNEGVPLVSGAPKSAPAAAIRTLAAAVLGPMEPRAHAGPDAEHTAERKGRGLAGLLRRS